MKKDRTRKPKIMQLLKENGGWMKTEDILIVVDWPMWKEDRTLGMSLTGKALCQLRDLGCVEYDKNPGEHGFLWKYAKDFVTKPGGRPRKEVEETTVKPDTKCPQPDHVLPIDKLARDIYDATSRLIDLTEELVEAAKAQQTGAHIVEDLRAYLEKLSK